MTPQVALLLAVLLAGLPASGARGGKAAKGAGGGYNSGHGFTNYKTREVTWEDIVLAMQLSSMCFGALLALCVVACCAYHICGPAEELDYTRYSGFKSEHPRLPPELLREIYTLPTTTSIVQTDPLPASAVKQSTTLLQPSPSLPTSRPAEVVQAGTMSGFREGRIRAASVGRDIRESLVGQRSALAAHLPNGRLRGPAAGETTPPLLSRPIAVQNTRADVCRPPRLLNLNCMVDGRPRLLTLSAMTSTRAAREVAGRGAANRLAAHDQTSSTLDLARAAAASIPSLSHTHRSFSEPHTSLV